MHCLKWELNKYETEMWGGQGRQKGLLWAAWGAMLQWGEKAREGRRKQCMLELQVSVWSQHCASYQQIWQRFETCQEPPSLHTPRSPPIFSHRSCQDNLSPAHELSCSGGDRTRDRSSDKVSFLSSLAHIITGNFIQFICKCTVLSSCALSSHLALQVLMTCS